jgi:hypothetical protein
VNTSRRKAVACGPRVDVPKGAVNRGACLLSVSRRGNLLFVIGVVIRRYGLRLLDITLLSICMMQHATESRISPRSALIILYLILGLPRLGGASLTCETVRAMCKRTSS